MVTPVRSTQVSAGVVSLRLSPAGRSLLRRALLGVFLLVASGYVTSAHAQTLLAPGISPFWSTHNEPVLVTLGHGQSGATIRESATLRVRAFRTDWTPSAIVSATYDITADTEAPTITAILRPMPNANGWNRAPVTVSFSCDDDVAVATCSPDVTVSTPGANQVVTGTVTDSSGLTASASVTLNLDSTKPAAAITSPAAGLEVATETIEVTGTVSDALSGVASAACGGQPATITAGAVICTVPLAKGKNAIVLEASDLAGNSASTTVSVFRLAPATSIRIVPSTFSMLVAETRILQVVDDFGRTVENATFTMSDTDVAEMDDELPMRVNALAPGTATIAATSGTLTAEATVTVMTVAVPNTAVWSVPAQISAGYLGWIVYPQNGGPDDPDLYLIEHAGGFTTLRGMKGDGRQLSINSVAGGEAVHAVGDAHGGVVLLLRQQTAEHSIDSIARVGPEGVWTRRSTGTISDVIVDSEDTIYALEYETHAVQGTGQFVVSSGTTELLKLDLLDGGTTHIGLPSYVTRSTNWDNCQYVLIHLSATTSNMTLDTENNLRILLTHGAEWGDPAQFAACGYESGATALTLSQLTIGPSGTSMQTLKQSTMQSLFDEPFWPTSIVATEPGAIAYDSEGGWVNGEPVGPPPTAIRLTSGGNSQITMAVPVTSSLAIGRNNVAYVGADNGIAAFDAATGALVWQSAEHGWILNVLDNGGVALFQEGETSGGFITLLDGAGVVTSTQAVPVAPYYYWGAGEWHGITGAYFTAVQAQTVRIADASSPRVPKMTHFYPIDLHPQVTAQQARARIENAVPAKRMTHEFYLKNGYATAQNFLNEIKDARNDAIGFIGHSVLDGSNQAYGLYLASPYEGPGLEETILRLPDPPPLIPSGPGVATFKRRLETQVKIAFIGSCGLGNEFKGLWDITPTTTGRVLISSSMVQVRLNVANVAWEQMIKALDDGCTVSEAVTKGNTLIHSMQTNEQFPPHPDPGTFVEEWEATGDGTLRLRTVRRGMCVQ
jgi:hypothetical protein